MNDRIEVRKTYKMFVNGAFIRSESGRSYEVQDADSKFLANVALCTRKDARDAVVAARAGQAAWAKATAYNRGQVMYRIAEVMESRRAQFEDELRTAEGFSDKKARKTVSAAIDRVVWFAGWTDKLSALLGSTNPVAGPFFNFSTPEPTGVIAIVAPQSDSLLGLVSVIAPAIASGNSVVVIANYHHPLTAVTFSEVLATSDVPAGVVNILTGDFNDVAGWLAEHEDVNAIDLAGVFVADRARELEAQAAVNLKRVARPVSVDWIEKPDVQRMKQWTELKTVWHPQGF